MTNKTDDHSPRHVISYMVGVYLGVNAIRDAFLMVDGPDCVYMKTQYLQGNQDYLSSLTSVSGFHRVVNTALEPVHVPLPREDGLKALMTDMAGREEVGLVMTTSMPLASVLGIDYGRLCKEASRTVGKDIIYVPGKSLSTDWLGGYEETLHAMARSISLDPPAPAENNVAVVGLLYDRNEEDNRGNIRELKRLLGALELEVSSVWFSGQNFSEYRAVNKAETIISLPYGRKAARVLADRLGAGLVETELPFGLGATERWVRSLGKEFGREQSAEAFIEGELGHIVPKLEWVVPFMFQDRCFGYVGDPHLLPGFSEIIKLLGGRLGFAVVTNAEQHLVPNESTEGIDHLIADPKVQTLLQSFNSLVEETSIDCLITNSACIEFADPNRYAVCEFGFPSYNVHALYDRPYLGFAGFLAFTDTMANQMRLFQCFKSGTPPPAHG